MFDANMLAGAGVGPACNISGGKYIRDTRLEELVNHDAPIDRQAGVLGYTRGWLHTDANDDQIRVDLRSVAQSDGFAMDCGCCSAEMENHSVLFVY